jgi:UDP-N-acetylmuramoyl-tripeptide--D-alanyl-D-alanine ligase
VINGILSFFNWRYPRSLVYMLQNTEYKAGPYFAWFLRTKNFNNVAKRRTLHLTKVAKLLLISAYVGMLVQIVLGIFLICSDITGGVYFGIALLISYPVVWAFLLAVPLVLGRWLIISPLEHRQIKISANTFSKHKGTVVAVAGSFGKTTMKELLLTVLSEGKKVAATPGNKNVASSHAKFAKQLGGDEEVVIVEFGEGKPGDIKKFTATVNPDIAVITGIAPAHLDKYKTVKAVAKDMLVLVNTLSLDKVYINDESEYVQKYIPKGATRYSNKGIGGWKVKSVECKVNGLEFTATYEGKDIKFASGLLGRHHVGSLMAVIAIADKLGLSLDDIKRGVAKTKPFEHRMQPYQLAGAWVIDDTYNGNIEGIKAGLALLKELPAKRKIYITPGLVDQGADSAKIHQAIGQEIAKITPDIVVLMENSTTKDILSGMKEGNYAGEVIAQDNPLQFYSNLDQFVAVGDVVLMQNDWTDNYA